MWRSPPAHHPTRWLRHFAVAVLATGLMPATVELHSGATHPAMSRPAPVSVGASHADQSAHFEGLVSLQKIHCAACALRSRDQSLDPALPVTGSDPRPGGTVPELRGSPASLDVYGLGPSRAPPRL